VQHFFHVRQLVNDVKIQSPVAAKICHNYRPDWFGGKDFSPGNFGNLGKKCWKNDKNTKKC